MVSVLPKKNKKFAASVFGEIKRLEPMSPERKARWRKEIDWLLSVTDHIVELVPSKQTGKDGTNMEVCIIFPTYPLDYTYLDSNVQFDSVMVVGFNYGQVEFTHE